jgi:4-amino-4-deoxy-L-arabinose transferase-like glycosyltransferase
MFTDPTPQREGVSPKPWWREAEVGLLIALVVAAHFLRVGDVSMRGEEPRRAQVAFELLQRGDWVVPREQGEPFLSRPPLHNWLIALSTLLCGTRDAWAVRLPSVLATLCTTLLIFGYSRTCLSRTGALAAAAAFATMGEMFTTGYQAETEAVFIALVSASLLVWHWGQVRGWPALRTWTAGYAFVGLAVLTKGPQAPVYFLASVSAYLLLTGQWRRVFSVAHVAGVLVGASIVLAWLIACAVQLGWPTVWSICLNDTTARFHSWTFSEVATHLVQYPLEVVGCTMPWSLLLLFYLHRDFRRSLGEARLQILFVTICVAISFPTCWIPPGGQTRYFAPLYPCLAVLIGRVVQRCAETEIPSIVRTAWGWYLTGCTCLMAVASATVFLASVLLARYPKAGSWTESPLVALVYAGTVLRLAILMWRGRQGGETPRVRAAVLALAGCMVLTFTGILTNVRVRLSEDQAAAVARLKDRLPAGQRLVSFGHIDALFAYHYGLPIDALPWPSTGDRPTDEVWFCFDQYGGDRPPLPFAWEEVAVVPMDRNRHELPERMVVVGRRLQASKNGVSSINGVSSLYFAASAKK